MGKIKRLPAHIIPKIAAGEVVERPASVVKELIENSIDAKATRIEIYIEKSGCKKIETRDNGQGMDKEDTLKCFKPHTTSKTFTEKDLLNINSLGFRGEALASIASISKLTIKSKPANKKLGTEIKILGGASQKPTKTGMPTGTIVIVEDIFFNTPGRKKFLKSPQTESKHIIDTVIKNALAFPKIAFLLNHNQKTFITLPSKQTLKARVQDLMGNYVFSNLIPIKHTKNHFKLSGFVSTPQISNKTKRNQFFFVNNRPIKTSTISKTIKTAYGTLLDSGAHPIFVLSLELPHEMVDVNVHPRKEKINFQNESLLLKFTKGAVQKSLSKYPLIYSTDILGMPFEKYTSGILKDSAKLWSAHLKEELETAEIIQVHNLYLVTQTKKGFLLVDQHAAHEKILYEQVLEIFKKGKPKKKRLSKSLTFDLPIIETQILKENLGIFERMGFDIEVFGKNCFKINALPQIIQNPIGFITDAVETVLQEKHTRVENEKLIAQIACKNAIKAGERLTPKEQKRLIKKLLTCKECYTCPHGRPTMIEVDLESLEKMFKRK